VGADPSVAELLDTMQSMHHMTARQSQVEQNIMDSLTYDTSEDEMGQILKFFYGMTSSARYICSALVRGACKVSCMFFECSFDGPLTSDSPV
jgi:hypothetical protein